MICYNSAFRYVIVEQCLGKTDCVSPSNPQICLSKKVIVFTDRTALCTRNSTLAPCSTGNYSNKLVV